MASAAAGRGTARQAPQRPVPRLHSLLSLPSAGVFRWRARGTAAACSGSRCAGRRARRALDRAAKWMRVPSVPDFFRPFAGWFVYGLGGDGDDAALAAEALFASNRQHGAGQRGGRGRGGGGLRPTPAAHPALAPPLVHRGPVVHEAARRRCRGRRRARRGREEVRVLRVGAGELGVGAS
ncbi:hypothetical protein ACP70R_028141 [Stipagrostis hirtigluma subsp. patula]